MLLSPPPVLPLMAPVTIFAIFFSSLFQLPNAPRQALATPRRTSGPCVLTFHHRRHTRNLYLPGSGAKQKIMLTGGKHCAKRRIVLGEFEALTPCEDGPRQATSTQIHLRPNTQGATFTLWAAAGRRLRHYRRSTNFGRGYHWPLGRSRHSATPDRRCLIGPAARVNFGAWSEAGAARLRRMDRRVLIVPPTRTANFCLGSPGRLRPRNPVVIQTNRLPTRANSVTVLKQPPVQTLETDASRARRALLSRSNHTAAPNAPATESGSILCDRATPSSHRSAPALSHPGFVAS